MRTADSTNDTQSAKSHNEKTTATIDLFTIQMIYEVSFSVIIRNETVTHLVLHTIGIWGNPAMKEKQLEGRMMEGHGNEYKCWNLNEGKVQQFSNENLV